MKKVILILIVLSLSIPIFAANDKKVDLNKPVNLTRYALNSAAMIWAYWAWTAALPYLAAWAWAYFIGKHGWKLSKELTKRWLWTVWWLTWGLVKWAFKWVYNSTKAWLKWEQKLNPVI